MYSKFRFYFLDGVTPSSCAVIPMSWFLVSSAEGVWVWELVDRIQESR